LNTIFLQRAQKQQGGNALMDLNSGKLITHNIIHEIPVTDVVIKAIDTMAYKQGFKSLKFKNRHRVIFHNADWIAGVDYDHNNDENEEEDDNEYHYEAKDNENKEELEEQE
jgi:phosphopantothenoylcysteine synthetase/decarboxylase